MTDRISRMSRHALIAAVAATLSVAAAPDLASAADSSPGSAGVGDEYFPKYGNGGYDVRNYDIDVRFDTDTERLTGTTTIRMTPTQRLTRFNLDLVLRASRVSVNGEPAAFTQTAHELKVTPSSALANRANSTVVVEYAGVPKNAAHNGNRPWITTRDGAIALGQPEIAAWWFPSNDHPTDKAKYRIDLTVPRGKEAISNGRLEGKETNGDWTTWHCELRSQAATYLVFAAIGDYRIEQGTTASGRPYLYAFGTNVNRAAKRSVRYTAQATEFLESQWGPYPFKRIGGVVPNGYSFGFALETQTRPVYQAGFFLERNPWVVVHEMAHQWFGNSVAVNRWKNIWLNEGFATYSEWVWAEGEGIRTAQRQFLRSYDSHRAGSRFWDLTIGDPGNDRLFDGAVYERGAMTTHALRNRVGDSDFFRIMRSWVRTYGDGNASTKQFKALAERISGEELNGLFNAWLFRAAKPAQTADNGF